MSIEVGRTRPVRNSGGLGPILLLVAGMTAWLWPIGPGGRMPVGGDVTGFSIGLMDVLRSAIVDRRLPLWNDLWGYGFPGLAESQMGVYYPPHWLLYGSFSTEVAYTASLALHSYFAAIGAYWAGRRFGVSPGGSAIGAWAFAAGGIFVVHLPHQWAASVGSWTPWAFGLAWSIVRGTRKARPTLLLAAVLAIQALPGHFQLAFETQVGVLGLAAWSLIAGRAGAIRSASLIVAAGLLAATLAAMQLVPTARLAALASTRRDAEYLSGFASTPIHLVSYVAPGLFHRSPLWRPVAWDPFHTSPEEHLGYVGLVGLFLASVAISLGRRRDPAVPALLAIVIGGVWLGLGPYLPGFHLLGRLPGFSFFRAPARWGLVTSLGLGLLAGIGFDLLRDAPRAGRSLARFAILAALYPTILILGFELALVGTEGRGIPEIRSAFEGMGRLSPWKDDPSFSAVMAAARRPQNDLRVRAGLAREGIRDVPRVGLSLDRERGSIYVRELGASGITILSLILLAAISRRSGAVRVGLVVVSGLELVYWGRLRTVDLGPIRPLSAQSPVLARLGTHPRGTRTADPMSNLPMIAGSAPIGAYRTLDLPVVPGLTGLARSAEGDPSAIRSAMRAAGASVRILGTGEVPNESGRFESLRDLALASWLYGADWVAGEGSGAANFRIWIPEESASRAWILPRAEGEKAIRPVSKDRDDAAAVLSTMKAARPADSWSAPVPERFEARAKTDRPAMLIVSMLHDPEWSARISGPGGEKIAEVRRAFGSEGAGAWIGIDLPTAGDWMVTLDYRGSAAMLGLGISAVAWASWFLAYWGLGRTRHDPGGDCGGVGLLGPGADPDPPAPPVGEDHGRDVPAG